MPNKPERYIQAAADAMLSVQREYQNNWRHSHADRVKVYNKLYYARRAAKLGRITTEELQALEQAIKGGDGDATKDSSCTG